MDDQRGRRSSGDDQSRKRNGSMKEGTVLYPRYYPDWYSNSYGNNWEGENIEGDGYYYPSYEYYFRDPNLYDNTYVGQRSAKSHAYRLPAESEGSEEFSESKKKICGIIAAIIVSVCLVAIALGIGIYFGVVEPSRRTSPDTKVQSVTFVGSLTLNRTFTPALNDSNSTEYKQLAESVTTEVDNAYKSSSLRDVYGYSNVTGFSSGSVVAHMKIHFTADKSSGTAVTADSINTTLSQQLKQSSSSFAKEIIPWLINLIDIAASTTSEVTTRAPTTTVPTTQATTTAASTVQVSTTAAPITSAPITVSPTTQPSTTAASTTQVSVASSTTMASTIAATTTNASTTAASTNQSSTIAASTTKAPTTLAPTTSDSATTASTTQITTTTSTTKAPTTTTSSPATVASTTQSTTTASTTSAPVTAASTAQSSTTSSTTKASTTASPTTSAPATIAPTTQASTTASTTKAPTTAAPTVQASTTAASTTQASTAASTTKASTTAAPTTSAPATVAPTTQPTTTASTTRASTTASPTTSAPATIAPTTQASIPASTTKASTTAPPTIQASTTAASTTQASTAASTTKASTTAAPTTSAPATAAPTTQPTTTTSTIKASTTASPTNAATIAPTTQASTTASTTKAPTTAAPTIQSSTTAASTTQASTAASTTKASTNFAQTTSAPATSASTTQPTTTASMINASTLASPTTSAAATIALTTQASITASTTKAPTTAAPTTSTTATAAPTTQASTTAASTTIAPITASPTTQASSTALTTSTTTTPMATTTVIYITTTEFITTTLANVVDIVDLNMTLNQTFNEKLRDENSTEYQTLKNQSEAYLTLVLKADNSTGNATHEVDSVQVLGFEPGSLIIKSQIFFRLVKMYLAGETRRSTDKSVLVEMLQSGIEKVRDDPKIRIPDVFKNLTAEAVTEVISLEVKVEPCRNFSKMEEYLLGSNDGTGVGLCEASVNVLKGKINQNGGVMDNDSCSTYHDMLDCLVTQFQLIDGQTCDWNNDFIQGGFVQQSGLLSKIAGQTSAGKYPHGQCVQIWRGQYKFEDLQTLGVAQSPCTDPHQVFYTAKYYCPVQRETLQNTNETGCKANLLNLIDCVSSSINMEYKQTCQVEQVADVIYDNQDYIAKSKYDIKFLRTWFNAIFQIQDRLFMAASINGRGRTPKRTTDPREATGKLSHIPKLVEPETQTHADRGEMTVIHNGARGCNAPYIEYLVNSECEGPLTLFDKVKPANKCRLFEYTVSCLTFISMLEKLDCDGTAVGQYVAQRWLRIRERYPGASNYTSIPCNVTGALPTLAPLSDLTALDICSDPDLFFHIFTFNCKAVIDKATLLGNKSCSYHWKKYECVLNNLNALSFALKRNNCSFDNVRAFMFPNSTNNSAMLLSKIQDKLTELSYPLDTNEFDGCYDMYEKLVSQGHMCDIFLSRRADAIKEHCRSVMNYSLEMALKFPLELKCWLAKETAICARTIISDLDPAGQCSLFNISTLLNDLVFSEMKNQQNWNTTYYSDCSALQDHTFDNLTACTSVDLVGLGLLNCADLISNGTQPCRKLDDFAICALQAAQQQGKKCDPSDIVVALMEYEWLLNNIYTSCHAGDPCTDLVLMKEAWKFGGCSVRLDKVQADLCSVAFSTAECVANFIRNSKGKTCSQDDIGMTLLSKMEDILLMAGENKTTIQEYVRVYTGFHPESCPGRGTLCPIDTFSMLLQGNCSAPLGVMHNPETTESEICGAYGNLLECLAFHMMLAGKDQCKIGSIHNTILKNLTRVVYTSSGRSLIQNCQGLNLDKLQARIPSPNEGSICSSIPIMQYYVKYLACQSQLHAFVSQTGSMHCGAYFGIVNGLSMFIRQFGFHCEYTKLMRTIQEHEANTTQIDKIFPSRVQLDQGCQNLYNMSMANSVPKARCEMFMANYSCEIFECAQPSVTIRNKTIFDSSLKCSVYYLSVKCLNMLMSKYEPGLACNYTVVGQLMNKYIDDYSNWSGQNSTSVTNFTQCTALDRLDQMGDICESDTLVALASMTCPEYLPMIRSNMNATHVTPVPNGQFQNTTNQQSCSLYQNLVNCGQQATASLGYHCQVSKIEMNFQNNSMLHLANILPQSDVPSKCSLTGSLFSVKIQLNVEWEDILADPSRVEHKELVGKIGEKMTNLLSSSQFGNDVESVRLISIGSTRGKFVHVDDIITGPSPSPHNNDSSSVKPTSSPPPQPTSRLGSSTPPPSPNNVSDRLSPPRSTSPPHNNYSQSFTTLSSPPPLPINETEGSLPPPPPPTDKTVGRRRRDILSDGGIPIGTPMPTSSPPPSVIGMPQPPTHIIVLLELKMRPDAKFTEEEVRLGLSEAVKEMLTRNPFAEIITDIDLQSLSVYFSQAADPCTDLVLMEMAWRYGGCSVSLDKVHADLCSAAFSTAECVANFIRNSKGKTCSQDDIGMTLMSKMEDILLMAGVEKTAVQEYVRAYTGFDPESCPGRGTLCPIYTFSMLLQGNCSAPLGVMHNPETTESEICGAYGNLLECLAFHMMLAGKDQCKIGSIHNTIFKNLTRVVYTSSGRSLIQNCQGLNLDTLQARMLSLNEGAICASIPIIQYYVKYLACQRQLDVSSLTNDTRCGVYFGIVNGLRMFLLKFGFHCEYTKLMRTIQEHEANSTRIDKIFSSTLQVDHACQNLYNMTVANAIPKARCEMFMANYSCEIFECAQPSITIRNKTIFDNSLKCSVYYLSVKCLNMLMSKYEPDLACNYTVVGQLMNKYINDYSTWSGQNSTSVTNFTRCTALDRLDQMGDICESDTLVALASMTCPEYLPMIQSNMSMNATHVTPVPNGQFQNTTNQQSCSLYQNLVRCGQQATASLGYHCQVSKIEMNFQNNSMLHLANILPQSDVPSKCSLTGSLFSVKIQLNMEWEDILADPSRAEHKELVGKIGEKMANLLSSSHFGNNVESVRVISIGSTRGKFVHVDGIITGPSPSPHNNDSSSVKPTSLPPPQPTSRLGSSTPPPSPNNVSDRLSPPRSTSPPHNNYSQSFTTLSSPPPLPINETEGSLPPPPPPTDKTVGRRRRDILSDGGIPIGTPMPTSSMPPIGIPMPPTLVIVLLELKMRPDAKFTEEEVRLGLSEAVKEMLTRNPDAEIITDIDLQSLSVYFSQAADPCTDLVLMEMAWRYGGCSVSLDKVHADLCSAAFSTAECVANFIRNSKGKTCSQDDIGMTLLSKMEDILLMAEVEKTAVQEYVRAYTGFDPESCPGRGTLCPIDTFSMLLQGNCSGPLGVMHNPETTESEICGAYGNLLECLAFHMMLSGKDQCKIGSIHNTILKNLTRVVYTSSGRSLIQNCQGLNLDTLQARMPSLNEGAICASIPIIQYYVKYLACQRQLDVSSLTNDTRCGVYFGIVNGLRMFLLKFGFHCEYTKLMRTIQEHEANSTRIDKIFSSTLQVDHACQNLYNMTVANSIPKARCEMFMANYSCEVFECAQPSVTIRNKTIFDSSLKCSVYYLSVKCLNMLMSKYEPGLACNYTVVGQMMNKYIDDYSTWSGQNLTSVTNFTQCTALDRLDQMGDICESDTLVALASMTCPEYLPMIRSNMSMNATHVTPVPNGQFQNTTNQQSCSLYQNLVRCGQQATASLGHQCQVSKIEMNFQNNSMLHLANILPQSDVPSKCSLTGSLFNVKMQLSMEWKDIFADPFSAEHKELVGKIHQMTSLLSGSQFGKDMESVRVISIGSTHGKFVTVDDITTRNSTPAPSPSPSDRFGSSTPSPSPNSRTDRSLPPTSLLPPHNNSGTVRPPSSSPSAPINGSGSSTPPPSPPINGSGSSTPPPSPSPPINGSGSSTPPPSPSINGSGSSTPPPSPSPPINGSGSSTPPPSPSISGSGSSTPPPSPPINGSGSSTPPSSPQPNNVSDRLTPPQSTLPPNNNYSQSLTTLSSPPPLPLNGTGGSLPPPNGTSPPPPPTDKTVGRRRRDIISDGGIPIGTPMPTSSMPPIGIPLPPTHIIVFLELKMRPDAKFTEEEVRLGLSEAVKEMLTRNPDAEIITDIDLQSLSVYFSQGTTVDKCRDPNLIRSAWSEQVCQADLRTFISGDHIRMCREFSQFVTCMIRYIQDHQMQTCTYKEVRDTLVENFESLLKELGLDQTTVTRVLYIFNQDTCYSAECTGDEFLLAALQTRCQVDWAVISNVNIDQSTKCSRYHSTINCIQMIIGNPGACSDDIILSTFIANMDYILENLNVDPNLIRVTFSPYNCTSSKPGFCPVSVLAGTCVMECTSDYACNGSKKCCYNNCGYTCQNPVSKPQCPTEMFKILISNNCSGPYNHFQNPSLGVVDGCRLYEDLLQCIAFHMIMSGNNMCTVEQIHHILMQQYAYILTRSDGASLANCTNTDWALLQAEIPGKSNEEVCRSIPTMQYYMKYVACHRNFKFSINLTDEVRCGIAFGILNGIQSFFHGFGFNCEFTQLMSTVSSHEKNSTLENKLLPPYLLDKIQTCQDVYFNGSLSSDPRLQCALIMANYSCPVVESLSPLLKMRNTTVYTSDLKCSVYYEFIKRVKTLLNKTVAYLPCNNEMLKTMVNGFIEGYWMESGQALDFAECTALETVNQLGSLCNQDTLVALSVMFCPARTQYGSILTTADPRTGSTQESSGMAVSTSWGEFCYTYQSLVQCGLQIANSTDFGSGYNCSHGDTEILFERVERDNYGLLLNSLPGGLNPAHCSKYSSMFNIDLKLDHKWTDSMNNTSSPEYMGMILKIQQSMDRLVNESFLSSYVAEVKVIQIGSWSGWMTTLQIDVNMTVKMKSTARLQPQEVSGGLIQAVREFTRVNTSDEIIPNINLYFIYVEPVSTEPSICTRETFKDLEGTVCHQFVNISLLREEWELCRMYVDLLKCFRLHMLLYHEDDCTFSRIDRIMMAAKANVFRMKEGFVRAHCNSYFNLSAEEYNLPAEGAVCSSTDMIQNVMSECNAKKVNMTMLDTDSLCRIRTGSIPCINETFASHNFLCDRDKIRSTVLSLLVGNGNCTAMYNAANRCDRYMMENYQVANHCGIIMFYITKSIIMKKSDLMCKVYYEFLNCVRSAGSVASFCSDLQMLDPVARGVLKLVHRTDADLNTYFDSPDFSNCTGLANATVGNICQDPQKLTAVSLANCSMMVQMYIYPYSTCMRYNYLVSCGRETAAALGSARCDLETVHQAFTNNSALVRQQFPNENFSHCVMDECISVENQPKIAEAFASCGILQLWSKLASKQSFLDSLLYDQDIICRLFKMTTDCLMSHMSQLVGVNCNPAAIRDLIISNMQNLNQNLTNAFQVCPVNTTDLIPVCEDKPFISKMFLVVNEYLLSNYIHSTMWGDLCMFNSVLINSTIASLWSYSGVHCTSLQIREALVNQTHFLSNTANITDISRCMGTDACSDPLLDVCGGMNMCASLTYDRMPDCTTWLGTLKYIQLQTQKLYGLKCPLESLSKAYYRLTRTDAQKCLVTTYHEVTYSMNRTWDPTYKEVDFYLIKLFMYRIVNEVKMALALKTSDLSTLIITDFSEGEIGGNGTMMVKVHLIAGFTIAFSDVQIKQLFIEGIMARQTNISADPLIREILTRTITVSNQTFTPDQNTAFCRDPSVLQRVGTMYCYANWTGFCSDSTVQYQIVSCVYEIVRSVQANCSFRDVRQTLVSIPRISKSCQMLVREGPGCPAMPNPGNCTATCTADEYCNDGKLCCTSNSCASTICMKPDVEGFCNTSNNIAAVLMLEECGIRKFIPEGLSPFPDNQTKCSFLMNATQCLLRDSMFREICNVTEVMNHITSVPAQLTALLRELNVSQNLFGTNFNHSICANYRNMTGNITVYQYSGVLTLEREYQPELLNRSSLQFRYLEMEIIRELNRTFSSGSLNRTYLNSSVQGFRNGSVIVYFKSAFSANISLNDVLSTLIVGLVSSNSSIAGEIRPNSGSILNQTEEGLTACRNKSLITSHIQKCANESAFGNPANDKNCTLYFRGVQCVMRPIEQKYFTYCSPGDVITAVNVTRTNALIPLGDFNNTILECPEYLYLRKLAVQETIPPST